MNLKHNDIIVWKGFKWSKLLTFDKYNISQLLIQITTLSRYTHTAIYYKYLEKEYLIQSTLKGGMKISEITGEQWFRNNIDKNIYDLYRFKYDLENRNLNEFQRKIQSYVTKMYAMDKKSLIFGSYSIFGLFNQFLYNFFGNYINSKTKINKMFCSELSYYYFTQDENSFLINPYLLTDSNLFRKII